VTHHTVSVEGVDDLLDQQRAASHGQNESDYSNP
jgi:hypothetical protein